jgi:Mg-chelatase subunit ChlD
LGALLLLALTVLLGMPREVSAQQAVRLRAVLVLDASGSMAANDPQRLVRVAAKMLADLADERDHITVISFGAQVKKLASLPGSKHAELKSAIDGLGRTEACTDYGQALETAVSAFPGKAPAGERRVVLFLTDGKYEPTKEPAGCDDYERGSDGDRRGFTERVERAADQLKERGARIFTIGLGNAPTRSAHSAALLRNAADRSGGKFLHAQSARDVPRIFASIFGALIGAPVMQDRLDSGRGQTSFVVPKGASRLHVVFVPQSTRDLDGVTLSRRGAAALPCEPACIETPASGYRLARVGKNAAGTYEVRGAPSGPVEVLVIPDVGLSLRIEGVPKVLSEGQKVQGKVALRTREGDAVKLSAEYLQDVVFTVSMGAVKLLETAPGAAGEAQFASPSALARGQYSLAATASHRQGLLDVPQANAAFVVMPQFALQIEGGAIRFDTMAEEGPIPTKPKQPVPITVTAPAKLPTDITLDVRLPEGRPQRDLKIQPAQITFGPDKPRQATVTLTWKDPETLRGDDRRYQGEIALVPLAEHARLLTGDKAWGIELDGKLRSWTLARYLDEYKWEIAIGLCLLLLILWIVGRVVADKFPPKARVHYVAVGEQFETDSLIKRRAEHGAYRSAKFGFPLGKKAKKLCFFRAEGRGFEVLPEEKITVTILDDTLPEGDRERRKSFKGRWQQRYRLSDRYEVWLTRS